MLDKKKLIILNEVNSTNEFAQNLMKEKNVPDGTIVFAKHQIHGKGHSGSIWESEKNMNFTFSLIIQPDNIQPHKQFYISMAVSVGIIQYLNGIVNNACIKWPNDIYINKRKIGGILIESVVQDNKMYRSVIGIGLNMNQTNFSSNLTNPVSLKLITGKNYNLDVQLLKLCDSLQNALNHLKSMDFLHVSQKYKNNLFGMNQWLNYHDKNGKCCCKIIDVEEDGRLVVQKENNKRQWYHFKEITYLP